MRKWVAATGVGVLMMTACAVDENGEPTETAEATSPEVTAENSAATDAETFSESSEIEQADEDLSRWLEDEGYETFMSTFGPGGRASEASVEDIGSPREDVSFYARCLGEEDSVSMELNGVPYDLPCTPGATMELLDGPMTLEAAELDIDATEVSEDSIFTAALVTPAGE